MLKGPVVSKPRFLPLSLNGENLWPCILEYGRAQDQLGWAGCTSHKIRDLRHKRCWFPSRHLTWASCCAGVSLATAERSLLVIGPCYSPHLHPKLRSSEEERREGRGERENKRMRISLLVFFLILKGAITRITLGPGEGRDGEKHF